AFEMGEPDSYAVDYEFQVPIFVLTHAAPEKHPKETETLKFTFVSDGIERAIALAKAAAGQRDVQVIGGASTLRQCLNAGLCDELHLDIVPVLLGNGLRLFEAVDAEKVKFEKIGVEDTTTSRIGIRLRVLK